MAAAAAIAEATRVAAETAEETDFVQRLAALDTEVNADNGDDAELTERIALDIAEATANLNSLRIMRGLRTAIPDI